DGMWIAQLVLYLGPPLRAWGRRDDGGAVRAAGSAVAARRRLGVLRHEPLDLAEGQQLALGLERGAVQRRTPPKTTTAADPGREGPRSAAVCNAALETTTPPTWPARGRVDGSPAALFRGV